MENLTHLKLFRLSSVSVILLVLICFTITPTYLLFFFESSIYQLCNHIAWSLGIQKAFVGKAEFFK